MLNRMNEIEAGTRVRKRSLLELCNTTVLVRELVTKARKVENNRVRCW